MQHFLGQPISLNMQLTERARLARCLLFTVAVGLLSAFAPLGRAAISESQAPKGTTTMARPNAPQLLAAPHPSLQFYSGSVTVGGTSKMVILIDNTNNSAITGLQFTDDLPAGIVIGNNGVSNYCGGTLTTAPNGTSFSLSNGTIDAHTTCVIYVDVVATTVGSWFNHTGTISSSNAASGDDVGATLIVTGGALLTAPSVSTTFTPGNVVVGGYSRLKITLSNNDPVNAIVGAQLFDAFPAGFVSAPNSIVVSNDCSPSVYPDTNALQIYGATIPAGSSCSVVVKVVGSSVGNNWSNQTGPVLSGNAQTAQGASASFTVFNVAPLAAPSLALTFSPPSVSVGENSDMNLTLTNPNAAASINGVQYVQEFPSGVVNADNGVIVNNTCGGTLVAPPGGTSVSLSGGNIPSSSSCSVTIRVKGLWASAYLVNSSSVYSGNANQAWPTQATLTVNNNPALLNPPGVTKAFAPSTVEVGESSQMTIALTNPNAVPITGAGFMDTYPPHMINAPSGVVVSSNTCGGTVTALPNGSSAQLSGGTIPPNGSCSVVINLTPTLPWSLPNHTGLVTSPNANPGMDASATLHAIYNVGGLLSAPTVSEAFSPPTMPVGGTSQMTITLSNPNAIAITNAQFSDTYPSGMVNASSGVVVSNSCGGSLTAAASGTSMVLSDGTVPASNECSIVVAVTGTAAGVYDNHTGVVTSANADFSADASAALTVTDGGLLPAPTITKAFSPSSVSVGETSLMTITLNNPAGSAITGVNLDDVYPSGMINAPEPTVASDSCNFQELVLANGSSAMLSNGTIPPGDSCSVVISVIGTAEGIFTNTTGSVYSDNAQTAAPGSATLTVTSSPPLSAPTVLKTFAPDSVPVGGVSLMTITLFNSNVSNAILGVGLDDIYPAGIISAPGNPVIGDTCFFNEDVPANGGWAKLSGGTLTPGGECSIMINVVGTATATNQTGPTTSSNAPIGASASATLTVTGAPLLPSPTATKTFTPAHINVGGTSQMTITLTNHSSNAVTGVQLTDVYPGGMVNAPGNSVVSDSCNFQELVPAAGGSATLTGGTIPAGNGNTCSIVIDVIGTSSGGWTNWTSPILSDNAASGASTSAMLQVSGSLINLQAPIATQTFSPASVVVGGTSKLTITLSNPAVNASAITGVQFTDTYVPAHMTNALSGASTDCGGSLTATPGDSVLTLTGGIIPVNGACNVTVDVIGTSIGTSTSDTGPVLSNNADPGANATATLTVTGGALLNAPIVQKSFTPASVNMGDISQMKISLTNPNASAITGVQVNDLYPAGIRNGPSSPVISDTCNFNEDVPGDGTWAKMYGGTIPGNGGCSIVINVVGTSTATNQTGPVPSGNALTGISANATLTVVGGAVNHPPVAVGDAIEVAPNGTANTLVGDTNVPASVLDNDSDPDAGDTLTATKVSDPSHGTVVLNADGTFLYQNDGTGTTDSFTYQACDSSNECSAETAVTITIGTGLSNHAPFAVDDAIQMTAGDTVDTLVGNPNTPSSVLDNDIDPDGDALTATKLTDPAYGDLTFSANGTFSYHNTAPATSDSFLYEACDAGGACALGRVAITIDANPSNRLPIVVDDAIQTTPNGSADTLIGDPNGVDSVLDNDSDPDASDVLTAAKASGLVNASGTVTLQSDGTFLYQNTDPSVATDMFLYEACDGEGACTPGIVSITISNGPMDLPPIAMDDALEVAPGGLTSTIVGDPNTVDSVLDNDSDPDAGDALVAHLISPPANGDITLNTNGTFTYVNTSLNAATDEFRYEACDGHGACVAATVSVVINQSAPTVLCVLPRQVDVVGDTVNIDLAQLFTAPAGQSLIYSADNLPPSLSIVGSLLSGILQASDVPGSPYASTLRATTVLSNVSATENVIFQVLPTGEIVLRNGFDGPNPTQPCT